MSEPHTAHPVSRHYATIPHGRWGARQVHYRRAGQGPCLVLLHQSPASSRDLLPAIRALAPYYTCIAPDTPGYGGSDPFGVPEVAMEDIADAVVEFLDAIGVERCAAYGFHTGAMIVGALAAHHPQRLSCAVSNGYVLLTELERRDFLSRYLPPFEPRWDGSHLAWLWARMREQSIFFPWYEASAATRMPVGLPEPAALQRAALEFLRAGDEYRVGYRAAFSFRSELALARAQVPWLVTAARHDPLHAHLARIGRTAPCVEVRGGGTPEETLALGRAFLDRHRAPDAPPVAATRPIPGRLWNAMVDVPGGQLRVRRNTDAAGRTVLVQHDAAGAADGLDAVSASLIGTRPVLAIDLPGHGDSDDTLAGAAEVDVERYARAVRDALDALALDAVDGWGTGGGGLVLLELPRLAPGRVHRLALADVPWFDAALRAELLANGLPAIEPVWYGGHLLHAWHLMRDQGLYFPWYDRSPKGAIRGQPQVDPATVHRRVVNLLKAPETWRRALRAHLAYPLDAGLRAVAVPTLLCAPDGAALRAHTENAARATGLPYRRLPDEPRRWGPAFVDFLDAAS